MNIELNFLPRPKSVPAFDPDKFTLKSSCVMASAAALDVPWKSIASLTSSRSMKSNPAAAASDATQPSVSGASPGIAPTSRARRPFRWLVQHP